MVVRLSGTQPQGPKHLETLENKTVDGTQNNVRINRGSTANRPQYPVVGEFYYNTDKQAFEQYTSSGWFNIAQAPGAPTSVVATDQGSGRSFDNGQASVAFTASTSGGAPSSFIVTPSPATSPATFTGTSSPITVTGLSSSTQYTYTATAVGTYGTSSASAASSGVTATTVPQAPTISATADDTVANINITPGSTGGSAITQYSIVSDPQTSTQTTSNTSYAFTGLTNGTTYTFFVTATNSNGTSLQSSVSNSVTPGPQGDFESIATVSLTSNQSTITFDNIPQTYKHLQLRITGRGTVASGQQEMALTVNGLNNIYTRHLLYGDGNTINADGRNQGDSAYFMSWIAGNNAPANTQGICIVDILDYSNTNKTKVISTLTALDRNGSGLVGIESSNLNTTSAVSSINLITQLPGNNFMPNSSFALYGIKG